MKIKRAIILAAGQGSRLRPLTNSKPKCLVQISGKSILEWNIKILKLLGVEEIIVVGGYKIDKLKTFSDIKLILNNEYKTTNMIWSLNKAKKFLNTETIISYGDIVYSPKILSDLIGSKADIGIAVDMNWKSYWYERFDDPLTDAETLKFKKGTFIIEEIGKKTDNILDIEAQYIGLIKLSKKGVLNLRKKLMKNINSDKETKIDIKNAYMTDFIQHLIDNEILVTGVPFQKEWLEIDTIKDLNLKTTQKRIKAIGKHCNFKNLI